MAFRRRGGWRTPATPHPWRNETRLEFSGRNMKIKKSSRILDMMAAPQKRSAA